MRQRGFAPTESGTFGLLPSVPPTNVMASDEANIEITEIDRVEIAVEPWSWEFSNCATSGDRSKLCPPRRARDPGSGTAACSCFTAMRFAIAYCKAPASRPTTPVFWRGETGAFPTRGSLMFSPRPPCKPPTAPFCSAKWARRRRAQAQCIFPAVRQTLRTSAPKVALTLPAASAASCWRKPGSRSVRLPPSPAGPWCTTAVLWA